MPRVMFVKDGGKGRICIALELDGESKRFNITVATYSAIGSPLRGDELCEEVLFDIEYDDARYRAMKKALSLLGFSDKNKKTLYRRLREAGYSKNISLSVVDECQRLGYIDERRQLAILIRDEANMSLRGRSYIRAKLYSKGYSAADIDAVTDELVEGGEIDFAENLIRLFEKKGVTDADERRMLMYKYGYKNSDI